MKLITEHVSNLKHSLMESASGIKQHYIEGIFMQAETENGNKRSYPKGVLKDAIDKYIKEQVSSGRAVGELNHPSGPNINLDLVSHRITELKWVGNDVIGKALILDTPMGLIVQKLLEGGVQLGVSSRGLGTVSRNKNGITEVNSDFQLTTVDIVQNPSAPSAFVNGLMESVDCFVNPLDQDSFVNGIQEGVEYNIDGEVITEDKGKLLVDLQEIFEGIE